MADCIHIEWAAGVYYKDGSIEMVPCRCSHINATDWDYQLVCSVCPYHRDHVNNADEVPF